MSRLTPKGMEECPNCDPSSPECDEDGRPYACYCCGDTGWVPEGTTASMQAEAQREAEEAAKRATNAAYNARALAAYNAHRARPRPMPASMDDDIPF